MKEIILKNIKVFFSIELIGFFIGFCSGGAPVFMVVTMCTVVGFFIINVLLGLGALMKSETRSDAGAYFLSSILIILVGYPTCFMGGALTTR